MRIPDAWVVALMIVVGLVLVVLLLVVWLPGDPFDVFVDDCQPPGTSCLGSELQ